MTSPFAILRFDPNDLLRIGGVDHVYVRPFEAGHVMRRHGGTLESTVTHAEMARAATAADFVHERGHFAETGAFVREHSGVGRLSDLPAGELPKVMWKLHWVEGFLKAEARGEATRSDVSVAAFVERKEEAARRLLLRRRRVQEARAQEAGGIGDRPAGLALRQDAARLGRRLRGRGLPRPRAAFPAPLLRQPRTAARAGGLRPRQDGRRRLR